MNKNNIDINSLYDDAIEEVCFIDEVKKQNICENCKVIEAKNETIIELRKHLETLKKILEKKV